MSEPYWPDFNDLWDYGEPAGTEEVFREKLPDARARSGSSVQAKSYYLQLLTQVARTLGLQKRFAEAHTLLDQVETDMDGGDLVEVRCLLERGRVYNSSGQAEAAVPLFKQAAALAEGLGADFYTVDALHMLGIAAPAVERLDWNLKAIAAAETSSDIHARDWMGSLYNNTGWTVFEEGRYDEALRLFKKAVAYREEQGDPERIDIARWCVAKTLRHLGRFDEALDIQMNIEDRDDPDGFVEEEIGECLLALGRVEEARPYFATAYEILSGLDWVAEDTERIQRLRDLSEV